MTSIVANLIVSCRFTPQISFYLHFTNMSQEAERERKMLLTSHPTTSLDYYLANICCQRGRRWKIYDKLGKLDQQDACRLTNKTNMEANSSVVKLQSILLNVKEETEIAIE